MSYATGLLNIPQWNFDGSSTNQSISAKIRLNPQAVFKDPFRKTNGLLVMCDCYTPDNNPAKNNYRLDAEEIGRASCRERV